jgi:hypothetical protein
MESLAYILIHLHRGSLPWQGLEGTIKKRKYDLVLQKKATTTISDLCDGLPAEFALFLEHACNLQFEEKPDYSYIRNLFHDLFVREGYQNDLMFDWKMLMMGDHDDHIKKVQQTKGHRGAKVASRTSDRR